MEDYDIIKEIGKGACGSVYLVQHKESKRQYAYKKVQRDESRKTRTKEAILREANILSNLKHPNIVAYHESFFDEDEEYLCIIQDYCDGGTLDEVIKVQAEKEEYFPESQVMQWFVQLAMAVQHMHSKKVLHRDLKTQNVFLTKKGTVKIGDFGISKMMDNTIDMASTCVGTPCYLSPELCQDIPYSSKSDIWAMGCLLYEMCALRPAFDANNLVSLFYKIVKGEYQDVPEQYSEKMQNLIATILNKSPDERPSASAVLLQPYVKEEINCYITEKENLLQQRQKVSPGGGDKRRSTRPQSTPLSNSLNLEDDTQISQNNNSLSTSVDFNTAPSPSNKRKRPQSSKPVPSDDTSAIENNPFQQCSHNNNSSLREGDYTIPEEQESGIKDYQDDFEDSSSDSEIGIDEDIPEELPEGQVARDSESEEDEYPDDFEDESDQELDQMLNLARNVHDVSELADDDYFIDEDGKHEASCKLFIREHCINALGQDKFEEVKKYCENPVTEEDLTPRLRHMAGTEHIETCYLLSELLTDT